MYDTLSTFEFTKKKQTKLTHVYASSYDIIKKKCIFFYDAYLGQPKEKKERKKERERKEGMKEERNAII